MLVSVDTAGEPAKLCQQLETLRGVNDYPLMGRKEKGGGCWGSRTLRCGLILAGIETLKVVVRWVLLSSRAALEQGSHKNTQFIFCEVVVVHLWVDEHLHLKDH